MKRLSWMLSLPMLLLGCGPASQSNPKELWIALNGSERALQLVPMQPAPF